MRFQNEKETLNVSVSNIFRNRFPTKRLLIFYYFILGNMYMFDDVFGCHNQLCQIT